MLNKSKIKMGSNKSFAFVFFIFFMIIGLWPLLYDSSPRLIFIVLSLFLLFLGIVNSKILTPLNKLWFSFGIILGAVISPIVMCLVFFLVLTPIGILVKILRKDLLLIKYDKTKKTYWIKRTNVAGTMKRQF